jgi:predicted nucleotidyltransferase
LIRKDTYEFCKKDGYDCVTYEIRKLVRLLIQCNPNLICFINSEFVIHDPIADTLIENRDLFLTTKAYHSFSKYALGQLERMTRTTPEEIKLISYFREKKLAENDNLSPTFPIVMGAKNEKKTWPINAQYRPTK